MRLWIMVLSLVLSVPVHAENRLTLSEVIGQVLQSSPALKMADFEREAATAGIERAQQSPALRAGLHLENFGGEGSADADNLEATLSLTKVLDTGGRYRLRGQLASEQVLLLTSEQEAERLDVLAEATRRFIELLKDQELLRLAEYSISKAREMLVEVRVRVQAGRSPDAELQQAEIALLHEGIELEHAEHELDTARMKLAVSWGDTVPGPLLADADLFEIDGLRSFEQLARLLEDNPELMRFATEKRISATKLELARAEAGSEIEISGGIRHFRSTGDTGLVMSLNVPLGTSSRAQPSIDEAELLRRVDPLSFEQRRLDLHATLFEVYQEIVHASEQVNTLRERILPKARQVLKEYENGYRAGRYSLQELVSAWESLLDAERESVIAAANYHFYRIEIDRLTGLDLSAGVEHE